jgi:hypothetical protein
VPHHYWLDGTCLDELAQRGFGDADVAPDADETDAAFFDQPPGKARLGIQKLSGLLEREQTVSRSGHRASFLLRFAEIAQAADASSRTTRR